MFSPDVSRPSSVRPKRTRQAAGPDESLKLPQAKRKRSALRRDTFEPLAEASLNEIAGRDDARDGPAAKINGHAKPPTQTSAQSTPQPKELTYRGPKKPEKRTTDRGAPTLTLSNNDFYTVTHLPALPDQIRSRPQLPYSCFVSPEHGYVLALTHTDALIWPYNAGSTTLSTREVISFKLPFLPAATGDPLPLATFTAKAANGEPGIVAVDAKHGKIVYWETITNASSFVPGQVSSGVQGSVPGMLYGEQIQELVNAEPAGFMLSFSHGRVAHLTIRDQMGRPAIGVQFLRKNAATSTGIFGSIRNVFGGDRRKGTPIVKTGGSRKGQRDVVVATEDAELEFWNTNLGVGNSLENALSFKQVVVEALQRYFPVTAQPLSFTVHDIELSAGPTTSVNRRNNSSGLPMMVLGSVTVEQKTSYYLIETVIDDEATVRAIRPITCYSTPPTEQPSWRPRLSLGKTHPVAFALFETAIVLVSLAKIRETPASQLMPEKPILPEQLQDCIHFQDDATYRVLGFAPDAADKQTSCIVGVQGFGMIKVTSHLRQHNDAEEESRDDDDDNVDDRVTAKTKLEQVVFFGNNERNPLDFTINGHAFSNAEIEEAALEISRDVLDSSSKHLPKSHPSISMQLSIRSKALNDLVRHLMEHHRSSVSRAARFELLLNADKLAAAAAIWQTQERIQKRYTDQKLGDREMTYLDFTLRALHETRQKYPNPEKGETDRVRHWLINSVDKIHFLICELVDCLNELQPMDVTDPRIVGEYMKEAVDLWIAAYAAAFKFREDNAAVYGLEDEVLREGVFVNAVPLDAPIPWTSAEKGPFRFSQKLIYDVSNFLVEWWTFDAAKSKTKKKMPVDSDGKPHGPPPRTLLQQLADTLPIEVELFNRVADEEIIQAETREKAYNEKHGVETSKTQAAIRELKKEKRERMESALMAISPFNMPGAIAIAEKMKDAAILVVLNHNYLHMLLLEKQTDPSKAAEIDHRVAKLQNHIETYYDTLGHSWVYASFGTLIEDGEAGTLLLKGHSTQQRQADLTWFLKKAYKSGQDVAKIMWINDVEVENDFDQAQKLLTNIAESEVDDTWSKKTELALAKLTALAADEAKNSRSDTQLYDHEMAILALQDKVYEYITEAVGPALDDKALAELAISKFAEKVVAKSPALKRQLKQALRTLLREQPLCVHDLVDILTLIDPPSAQELAEISLHDHEILGKEFSLAIKIVELSNLSSTAKSDLRASIWRRAMIRDDWLNLNETGGKDDEYVERQMLASNLYLAMSQVLMEEHVNSTPAQLMSPARVLEVDAFPRSIQARFAENEIEGMRKDLEKEQAKLKTFVEKGRLEEHYEGLVAAAEKEVRDNIDQWGEQMAQEALEQDMLSV